MENNTQKKMLTVCVVTPSGDECSFECESVQMLAQDNEKGCGGGSFGVRYGHADALAALECGELKAFVDGKLTMSLLCGKGYAKIKADRVTVITDRYEVVER